MQNGRVSKKKRERERAILADSVVRILFKRRKSYMYMYYIVGANLLLLRGVDCVRANFQIRASISVFICFDSQKLTRHTSSHERNRAGHGPRGKEKRDNV